MALSKTISTYAFTILALSSLISATCYWPGSIEQPNNSSWIATDDRACFPAQENSPCCATGWTCMSDGLCLINQGDGDLYYRGTCTDKTWNSKQCPGWCLAQNSNTSIPMSKCSKPNGEEWYCCPDDPECNCDTGYNVVDLGVSASTVTVILSTSWPGYRPTSSAFSTASLSNVNSSATNSALGNGALGGAQATSSPTTSPSSSTGSNTTAIAAGVGVGVGVVLIAGISIAAFMIMRRRRRQQQQQSNSYTNVPSGSASDHDDSHNDSHQHQPYIPGQGFYATAAVNEKAGQTVYEKSDDSAAATHGPVHTYNKGQGRYHDAGLQELDAPLSEAGSAHRNSQMRAQEPVELA